MVDDLSVETGKRIRTLRQQQHLTQEELAEKAELHPVYIGQVERGEKNLTIGSLAKILDGLGVSFSDFFKGLEAGAVTEPPAPGVAYQCYELIRQHTPAEQERLYRILREIDTFAQPDR